MAHQGRLAASGAFVLLLSALALACSFTSPVGAQLSPRPAIGRVRKELRRLSKQEIRLFVDAVKVMLNTSTEAGRPIYGDLYKDFKYFIIKHAVAVNDPVGDQGHGAPCFMTFHRTWLLEVEAAVLSVSPGLGALPFWDLTRDLRGGDISRNSRNYIFSSQWFGSLDGARTAGYAVTNGVLPKQRVPVYSPVGNGYPDTTVVYSGVRSTDPFGNPRIPYLRSVDNDNQAPFTTRYPAIQTVNSYRGSSLFDLFFVKGIRTNEFPMNYRAFDYAFCSDPNMITDWMDWTTCADLTTLYQSGATDDDVFNLMQTSRSPLLHVAPHWLIGGGQGDAVGDFTDASAAPNDFLFFLVHHTNIDRLNMIWQRNVLDVDPDAALRSWGYPASAAEYPNGWEGCWLDNPINAKFPFTDGVLSELFPTPPSPLGFTHYEILAFTNPRNATYTYDRMTLASSAGKKKRSRAMLGEEQQEQEQQEEEQRKVPDGFKWPKFWKRDEHQRRRALEQQDTTNREVLSQATGMSSILRAVRRAQEAREARK